MWQPRPDRAIKRSTAQGLCRHGFWSTLNVQKPRSGTYLVLCSHACGKVRKCQSGHTGRYPARSTPHYKIACTCTPRYKIARTIISVPGHARQPRIGPGQTPPPRSRSGPRVPNESWSTEEGCWREHGGAARSDFNGGKSTRPAVAGARPSLRQPWRKAPQEVGRNGPRS